jgi:aminodeoxyfutalosine deaminase
VHEVEAFIAALPKVELHLHLLGSARPGTVDRLARRQLGRPGLAGRLDPVGGEGPVGFAEITGFDHFVEVYGAVNALVTGGADVVDLVAGLAADLAAARVRYAEVTVTPLSHLAAGIGPGELAEALAAARAAAAATTGVELAWIFDISGDLGPEAGERTVDWVLEHQPAGTVGLGLGGPEAGAARRAFRPAFGRARAAGLRSVPHAGELAGPGEVWAALHELGADRIGHGISCVRDPRLVEFLADAGIPLEICPTSNVCTGAVISIAGHPLPELLTAAVPVTLATDDPGLFGITLNDEYLLCHRQFGLDRAALAELALAGVRAAFCAEPLRRQLAAEIAALAEPDPRAAFGDSG